MSGGMKFCGREVAITPRGFQNGPRPRRAVFLAPGAKAEKAGFGVVELSVKNPCLDEQARVEGELGNIQTQAWIGENAHEVFVVLGNGLFEASPVEHGLVCGLRSAKTERAWIPSGFRPERRRERVPIYKDGLDVPSR